MNREAWLTEATKVLIPTLKEAFPEYIEFPDQKNLKCSVGWARSRGRVSWSLIQPKDTSDGSWQFYITPNEDNASNALSFLAEGILQAAHTLTRDSIGKDKISSFIELGRASARSKMVTEAFEELGDYPHHRVFAVKKDGIRQRKVVCGRDASYFVRMSAKMFNRGAPICPCHNLRMKMED